MANSLLGQKQPGNSIFERVSAIRSLVGGNPEAFGRALMQSNPQFAKFVNENMGKSEEQIAREHNIDYGQIRPLLK